MELEEILSCRQLVASPRYLLNQVNLEGESVRFRWLRAPATTEIALTGITALA